MLEQFRQRGGRLVALDVDMAERRRGYGARRGVIYIVRGAEEKRIGFFVGD